MVRGLPFRLAGDLALPGLAGIAGALLTLALLAAAAGTLAWDYQAHHRQRLATTLTVRLPANGAPEAAAARLQAALALVRAEPGVAAAAPLPQAHLRVMLAPYLGSAADSRTLPLPHLIDVTMVSAEAVAPDELADKLAALAPGAHVDAYAGAAPPGLDRLMTTAAVLVALAAVLVAVVAALAGLTTRADLVACRGDVTLLLDLGATDADVARPFVRRITVRLLAAAVIGAAALTAVTAPVWQAVADLSGAVSVWRQATLLGVGWAVVCAAAVASGWWVARRTAARVLRREF